MDTTLFMLAIQALCVLVATTLHEFVRAVVSTLLGDKKPKTDGRLTINPAKHFEPIGFILALLTGCGWGKPVETSALFYKNRKAGVLMTAVLPTVANVALAFVCGRLLKLPMGYWAGIVLAYLVRVNVALAVYNLMPVTPMDCLKVLSVVLPANTYFSYLQYEKLVQMVFFLLLFFGYTSVVFQPIISLVTTICLL